MIVCASCHARNANRSTFCIRCGAALAGAAESDPGSHTDAFVIQPEQTPAGLIDIAATQLAEGHAQAAVEAQGCDTLEPAYCLGLCAQSPAGMLGERLHARLTPARLDALLAQEQP